MDDLSEGQFELASVGGCRPRRRIGDDIEDEDFDVFGEE